MSNFPQIYRPTRGRYSFTATTDQWQYGLWLPDDAPFEHRHLTDLVSCDQWDRLGPSAYELEDPWCMANRLEVNLNRYIYLSSYEEEMAKI